MGEGIQMLVDGLAAEGYLRTPEQVRAKFKALKHKYPIKDTLLRIGIPLQLCRGQAFLYSCAADRLIMRAQDPAAATDKVSWFSLSLRRLTLRGLVIHGLKKSNKACSFTLKRHKVKTTNSRKSKGSLFCADAQCRFKDCYLLLATITILKEDLIASVQYSGRVRHAAGETHTRYIRGDERKRLKDILKYKPPRRERLDRLGALGQQEYDSGCRVWLKII
ncbi:hypothetical protein Bbelb_052100 [Branchiostoma belcheri]|nr:hypothetical protein Bbelb_052100 [Branchiostoma belcheri]